MGSEATVISLSPQDVMRLDVIVTDQDEKEALAFVRELRSRVAAATIRGMKSHLDK